MRSAPRVPAPPGTDRELQAFLEAPTAAAADGELQRLIEQVTPLIVGVVHRGFSGRAGPETEDAISEARTQVASRLQRLRLPSVDPADMPPAIADFSAYVCTVAQCARAEILRQRYPGRAKLCNRLRYLLDRRTTQHGFALWTGEDGEFWAGFAAWRGTPQAALCAGVRQVQLVADPDAAAVAAFGPGGWLSLNVADLIAGLFSWLGGPLKLHDLTDIVARLQGVPTALSVAPAFETDRDRVDAEPVDPHPSPNDELRWKEYLCWLREQTNRLTAPQRSAFLLHSHCLHEMELLGLTSVRQAASALGLSAERMAELWNTLPLDDLTIGALHGVGRQQVINWRKAARSQLGRAWQSWIEPGQIAAPRNLGAFSAS